MKVVFARAVTAFGMASVVILVLGSSLSSAHPSLRNFIRHRAVIAIGVTYIDVTLELVFHEQASARERARMDGDDDGRVTWAVARRYLDGLAAGFEDGLTLTLDGAPLDLVPLDDARLDLMGEARVHPHPHAVRLSYFARTPPGLAPRSVLALKDGLWPETEAFRSVEITGTPGFRFSSLPIGEAGSWRARCEAAPVPGPADRPSSPPAQWMRTR